MNGSKLDSRQFCFKDFKTFRIKRKYNVFDRIVPDTDSAGYPANNYAGTRYPVKNKFYLNEKKFEYFAFHSPSFLSVNFLKLR